jgi:hypothetical protein
VEDYSAVASACEQRSWESGRWEVTLGVVVGGGGQQCVCVALTFMDPEGMSRVVLLGLVVSCICTGACSLASAGVRIVGVG